MKFYEYMAKEAFSKAGIPVPRGGVAGSPEEAARIAAEVGGPVAVKSQVLAGGRGKAGGIKFADTPDEARRVAAEILGMELKGFTVDRVLVEEKLQIDDELYLGFAIDKAVRRPLLIASTEGGVNIEEVADKNIVKRHIDIAWGFKPYEAMQVAFSLGLSVGLARQFASIALKLFSIFREYDVELTEINPLVISGDRVIAADGRLNIDDDSLFRHKGLPTTEEGTEMERRISEIGLAYVELDGDIAVMANGAGITMATLDILKLYGGSPANFLDAGGGASMEPMAKALAMLVETKPKAVLINIFGGITRCDDVANALVKVKESMGLPMPVVVRLVGTNEEEGVEILRNNGLEAYQTLDEAARKVVEEANVSGNTG